MKTTKEITAQEFEEFKDSIIDAEVEYDREFEYAKSMNDDDMEERANKKWDNAIRRLYDSVRQQAFSEGRKDGLKEMYTAVSKNFNVSQELMSEFPH